jgi:homocysteine S-methyltransferase
MTGAAALRDAGADAITMADNSLAQTRMSNLAMGYLVKDRLGMRPLLHVACRDRNLIGTQSHLMGLHALGIDHLLAITGDPAGVGDLPGASSVYDLNSFELIRMSKQLNEGIAFSGKPLKQRASFVVGSAFDPNVKYIDKAVLRMEKKIEAGADYFMTQPVYDAAMVERLYHATRHIKTPIFVGIMPLISGRNAEFLHNEVPGIRIPDAVRSQMAGLEGEEGRKMGVKLAKELLDVILGRFSGIYLMTPMLFYEMTAELTRYAKERVFPLVPSGKMH